MLRNHPAFCFSRGHVSLRTAEQAAGAASVPAPPPPVQPPPPVTAAPATAHRDPACDRPGSFPLEVRFPPRLVDLVIAYFTAPERVGRAQVKKAAIIAIVKHVQLVPEWKLQPRAMVVNLINNHPAFECDDRLVSLRRAEPSTAAPPPVAATTLPDVGAAVAPEAAVAAEHARRKRSRSRSRSRSPPSRRMVPDAEPAPDAAKTTQPAPPPAILTSLPAPSVQPPPLQLPVTMPSPSAASETCFPPGLVELAVSYFLAPERVGRDHNKKEAVQAIWQQSESLAGGKQPCALVKQMLNEHPAFVCAVGRVSLQGAGAEQAPVAPLLPARDLCREEEVLIDRLVAFFRAKAATSLPLHSVAGSCQLTPPLRRTYGTLRAFLLDPARARGGACFRVDGDNVLLKRVPAPVASMVEPALTEAAYIAEVVRQLRFEPAGELSVPVICGRCLLPAALKPRGTLAVLAAHRDVLEIRSWTNGNYYVRLAQRAETALPVVGAALAHDAAVVAEEHARRKRRRSRSSSRSRSCSPPGKLDVADQEHNADLRREEELLVGRVVAYFHAKESMLLPFHSVAGACQLTPLLRRKYATLRAFLVDPANTRGRFRVEGENLLFPRHCIEAAYIADVVRQLRFCAGRGAVAAGIGRALPAARCAHAAWLPGSAACAPRGATGVQAIKTREPHCAAGSTRGDNASCCRRCCGA